MRFKRMFICSKCFSCFSKFTIHGKRGFGAGVEAGGTVGTAGTGAGSRVSKAWNSFHKARNGTSSVLTVLTSGKVCASCANDESWYESNPKAAASPPRSVRAACPCDPHSKTPGPTPKSKRLVLMRTDAINQNPYDSL